MSHRQSTPSNGLAALHGTVALLVLTLAAAPIRRLSSQAARPAARPTTGAALVRKYANTDLGFRLLNEPRVRAVLVHLLGNHLQQLERNLDVSGPVDLIGGSLSVSGNAPHQGGEEEGIVCVASYDLSVYAAILSGGTIEVFTAADSYAALSQCIKDWITQVNSGHRDRFEPPTNVRIVTRR
jgi:hypothetical protein